MSRLGMQGALAILFVGVVLGACAGGRPTVPGPRPAPVAGRAAWDELVRRLPGRWIGTAESASVEVEFRLLSRGSVLLELFGSAGRQTATAYHLDGAGLIATHYCARGNQPRLRMTSGERLHPQLVLADVTDHDGSEPVLVELGYDLAVDGGFARVETYRQADGALARTTWRFVRAP